MCLTSRFWGGYDKQNSLHEVIRLSEKLITILTSVYNKAPYLETWAFSVASQTYLDKARVIVIDDGSTDDSLAQLKKCVAKYNIPIELYVHEKNMGFLSTVVESYGMIETKYFTILDADDYWLSPRKLEKAVNFLEKHDDFSMYASNYLNVNKDGRMSPAIPLNMPSQIFFTRKDSPFFQTSAAIFRNFFTPDFLTLTVEAEKKYPCAVAGGDTFRDLFAFKFGKCFFENSLEAAYLYDIGVYGGLPKLEQWILTETEFVEFFKLYYILFGVDDNAIKMLYDALEIHPENINALAEKMNDTANIANFKVGKYTKRYLEHYAPGSDGIDLLCDVMISHEKFFKELDL